MNASYPYICVDCGYPVDPELMLCDACYEKRMQRREEKRKREEKP